MFIVSLTYIADLAQIEAQLPAHLAWLERGYAAGIFLASGRKVPRTGGIILAQADDLTTLEGLLADDPFRRHGLARYEVTEFIPSKTAAALTSLRQPTPVTAR